MNILALETATSFCSAALLTDKKLSYQEDNSLNSHTQKILPMVDALLKEQQLTLADLDTIAFDCGPGSFTGLRIGAGVAQGLGFAHQISVTPISSLLSIAEQANQPYVAVALDARMSEVYFCCFEKQHAQKWRSIGEPQVLKMSDLSLDLSQNWCLAGNGWTIYQESVSLDILERALDKKPDIMPKADSVARLTKNNPQLQVSCELAIPSYIRQV